MMWVGWTCEEKSGSVGDGFRDLEKGDGSYEFFFGLKVEEPMCSTEFEKSQLSWTNGVKMDVLRMHIPCLKSRVTSHTIFLFFQSHGLLGCSKAAVGRANDIRYYQFMCGRNERFHCHIVWFIAY